MDRAEDIPARAKPIPGLAGGRLLQRQRADQDRHGDLLPGRRRQSDAYAQEPAAARSAIFHATAELAGISINRTPVGWAKSLGTAGEFRAIGPAILPMLSCSEL